MDNHKIVALALVSVATLIVISAALELPSHAMGEKRDEKIVCMNNNCRQTVCVNDNPCKSSPYRPEQNQINSTRISSELPEK
jgi:hypothetical protein